MTLGTLHRNITLAGFLYLKILIGVMCLFLFSVESWGACSYYSRASRIVSTSDYSARYFKSPEGNRQRCCVQITLNGQDVPYQNACALGPSGSLNTAYCVPSNAPSGSSGTNFINDLWNCSSQEEAQVAQDSLDCVNAGNIWGSLDGVSNKTCITPQTSCEVAGGTWDGSHCTFPKDECEQSGGTWDGSQCNYVRDTTFQYCKTRYEQGSSGQWAFYFTYAKCKGKYDQKTGNIDFVPEVDCVEGMKVPGTCAQNGYSEGIQKDTTSGADDVNCYSIQGNVVWIMGVDGKLRPCQADGDCAQAKRMVKDGRCSNGAENMSSSSSTGEDGGSSSSSPESSASSSDGTSSSGEGGEGEYSVVLAHIDGDLHRLNDSVGMTNVWLSGINSSVNTKLAVLNENVYQVERGITSANVKLSEGNEYLRNIVNRIDEDYTYTPPQTDIDYTPDSIPEYVDTVEEAINDSLWNVAKWERNYYDSIRREWDSTMRFYDSLRADTVHNYVALDSIYDWSDTNAVKEKFGRFMLPGGTTNTCFCIDRNIEIFNWSHRLYVDFGNYMGFDLCGLVRAVVRFLTTVIVLFTTIKGFVRAFSNGGNS